MKSLNVVPIILAGGSGTRLWPLSRPEYPKQFLRLCNKYSLLQNTLLRIHNVSHVREPIIVCNCEHLTLVQQQLSELTITAACIITEPVRRNTAPAIAIAAMQALHLSDEDDVLLLILPADHVVDDLVKFQRALEVAQHYAAEKNLVCFGILPTRAETGYGYIKRGEEIKNKNLGKHSGFKVEKFIEKPDALRAAEYLKSQQYYWNSGMFMFGAQKYLEELQCWEPDIFLSCQQVMRFSNIDAEKVLQLGATEFAKCRSISIDYAVMERTARAVVVPLDVGWSDIGSWASLWEHLPKDKNGNMAVGDAVIKNCTGSYINADTQKVVAIGVKDLVIVEANGRVLIMAKDKCQNLKGFVEGENR